MFGLSAGTVTGIFTAIAMLANANSMPALAALFNAANASAIQTTISFGIALAAVVAGMLPGHNATKK